MYFTSCEAFTKLIPAARSLPRSFVFTRKSSCADSANCKYLSLFKMLAPQSKGVIRKPHFTLESTSNRLRLSSALVRVTKFLKRPDLLFLCGLSDNFKKNKVAKVLFSTIMNMPQSTKLDKIFPKRISQRSLRI